MNINRKIHVAPSLLSADFSNIQGAVQLIENSGGDWIHLDVMDGYFVPNITFGPKMVQDIRPLTTLPLDVHLMIVNPERYIDAFAEAGSDYITFHIEAVTHAHRLAQHIKDAGAGPGISIVPSTPISTIVEMLPVVDLVLIMTVNPGFGGQELIPGCLDKVRELTRIKQERGFPFLIAVDGGVNINTAKQIIDAGTDVLISGSAFFKSREPARMIQAMKGAGGN